MGKIADFEFGIADFELRIGDGMMEYWKNGMLEVRDLTILP
jgi:hypothetical protein